MNERLEAMRRRVRVGEHKHRRLKPPDLLAEFQSAGLSWMQRSARLTSRMCAFEAQHPQILPDEKIVFTRTATTVPESHSTEEMSILTAGRTIHELGPINNICPDWGRLLAEGLEGRRQVALASRSRLSQDAGAVEFLDCALETIEAVLALAASYAANAQRLGKYQIAQVLERVPAHPPNTFLEALQFLRLCHAAVWLNGHYHVGLGRFDQYMWPYLRADLEAGRIDLATAEELLAEFFISLNKDSDLYPGVQQGDNGQTLCLGGVDREGNPAENEITYMSLRVSRDLELIDPKINLRISPDTDLELLTLAAELTRKGLGFPQFANDEVIIPGLIAHGYAPEDARDYTVAACWEFIIPGRGMEVVNIGAVSLPAAADRGIRDGLANGDDFPGILGRVKEDIRAQVDRLVGDYERLLLPPAPFFSVLMDGCLERGEDLSGGLVYNNFGIHGAGAANAADALAAVKFFVYQQMSVSPDHLLQALKDEFSGHETLRQLLAERGPKVGNQSDLADELLRGLFDDFAEACEDYGRTSRGGLIRPGTGSAMYYLWLASGNPGMREPVVGATAEGRQRGKPLSANLSPSLEAPVAGPISVLQSFSQIDYRRVCNGGPITMELSDTVFRDTESLHKVALLVRTFAQLGCQQLQLNSLSLERLLEAKAHPEEHQNLIVRVWGWSGYFCELAPEYQDHIIARHMYAFD